MLTKTIPWKVETTPVEGATTVSTGAGSLTLQYKPFRLTVNIGGAPAIIINDRDMFNFETRRQKQVRHTGTAWMLQGRLRSEPAW